MMNKLLKPACGLLVCGCLALHGCSEPSAPTGTDKPTKPATTAAAKSPAADGKASAVAAAGQTRAAPAISLSAPVGSPQAVVRRGEPPKTPQMLAGEAQVETIKSGIERLSADPTDPESMKALQQNLQQASAYRQEVLRQVQSVPAGAARATPPRP